uniref:Toll-like receptor 13 n=1 Tax=Salarias fasciatus TaxID=181472 RepID=A0A672HIU5_SALFA
MYRLLYQITSYLWSLLLLSLLFWSLRLDLSLSFSLKNCTISYFPADANANGVAVECSSRKLAVIPNDVPRNTTSLDLSMNRIVRISTVDLRGLFKLKDAQFHNNWISHIDDRAFKDLKDLNNLDIAGNKLTELTDDMFEGLTRLETLVLNDNQISSISSGAFQHLLSVRLIELGENNLTQISDVVPAFKVPTLKTLQLEFNNFESLEFDSLSVGSSSLTSLDLSINPLTRFSLKEDVFPHLQNLGFDECFQDMKWEVANKTFLRSLDRLTLSGTSISFKTYKEMLQTTDNIQNLVMANMDIWVKSDLVSIACQISSLSSMFLTGNNLGFLNRHMLHSCSGLTKLNLFLNQLTGMSEDAFQPTPLLRVLLLSSNRLTEVPAALLTLSSLEKLDLSSNFITQLRCSDFHNLTRLLSINLQLNRIFSLKPCVFQNLQDLKQLYIGQNSFFIVGDCFKVHLWKLESLDLSMNEMTTIQEGDFATLSSLQDLILLSDKSYRVAHGAFRGLDSLQTLSLNLAFFPNEVFSWLPSLETLNIHLILTVDDVTVNDNPPFSNLSRLTNLTIKVVNICRVLITPNLLSGLKSLQYFWTDAFFTGSLHPDTFKYTPRLRSLKIIRSNLLELSPELFRPLKNLKELDLSNNKLRSLGFLAEATLSTLNFLNLSENELLVINETVFHSLPVLTYLDLSENPLACECSNSGFIRWAIENNQTQIAHGHGYTCVFPVSQGGNRLLEFDVLSCWVDVQFLCFLSTAVLVSLVLLSSFVHRFLRFHLTYAYHVFLAFLYHKRRRKNIAPHRYDAFVSYNMQDEAWVYEELVPELEGQQGWKLCLHHRDFEPGRPIVENITDAIYSSRKTICVISQHYLQSEWCSREIQMASFRLFDEHRDVLILLFMEDVPGHLLGAYHRMRSLVKRHSYLSWPRSARTIFWQNVQRALGIDQEDLL